MIELQKLIDFKLAMRIPREKRAADIADICYSAFVKEIKQCASFLGLKKIPTVIPCNTLAKNFSAFILRGESYLFLDDALLEFLHLFNIVIVSKSEAMRNKFLYRFISEEFIKHKHINEALLCFLKYNSIKNQLLEQTDYYKMDNSWINYQFVFLIGHELTHLSIIDGKNQNEFNNFIMLIRDWMLSMCKNSWLYEFYKQYFAKTLNMNIDDFLIGKNYKCPKFDSLLEECFCDFKGFLLTVNNYKLKNSEYHKSFEHLFNFLMLAECVKQGVYEAIDNGGENIESKPTFLDMYFLSDFRLTILSMIFKQNNIETNSFKAGGYFIIEFFEILAKIYPTTMDLISPVRKMYSDFGINEKIENVILHRMSLGRVYIAGKD
ncbi:MAG: hypothetical protein FWC71_02780 [Defluviitaleaceae bacterium]|nr:hypothetical protein [Defluviitaleaceae bacterium]